MTRGTINITRNHKIINALLLIYLISAHVFSWFSGLNNVTNVVALCLVVMCLFSNKKITVKKNDLYYLLYVFALAVSLLISIDASVSSTRVITALLNILLIFSLQRHYQNYPSDYLQDKLIGYLFIAGMALCLFVLFRTGFGNVIDLIMGGTRIGVAENEINNTGILAAYNFTISIFLGARKEKIIYYLYSIIPALVVLLTGSKVAIVLVAFSIIVLVFIEFGLRSVFRLIIGVIVIIIGLRLLANSQAFEFISNRFTAMYLSFMGKEAWMYDVQYMSTVKRMDMIQFGFELFKDKPLFGYGMDTFRILYSSGQYSHNNFIELLVGMGSIGFIVYYYPWISIVIKGIKGIKNQNNIILVLVLECLMAGFTIVQYYDKITYFILLLGFLAILNSTSVGKEGEGGVVL